MTRTLTTAPGLPGLFLPDRPPGQRPSVLLAPGPLLLTGAVPGEAAPLGAHRTLWGRQPLSRPEALITHLDQAGVVGAGGAGFPTARKLASLTGARVGLVVVNGAEGESASGKDGVLLGHVPHLVLDGAAAVAHALGAPRIVVRIADRPDLAALLHRVLAERDDDVRFELSVGPDSFVAGEATAVIRSVLGGPALPADLGRPPVAPARAPWARTPVMLSNVETFARVAVASRGIRARSALLSASGAVHNPGVLELPETWSLEDVALSSGGLIGGPEVLITGGWHGRWIPWDARAASTALTREDVAAAGGRWGAGAFVWVPGDVPGIAALSAVAAELARGTAEQCGPCWRGLPEVAQQAALVAAGSLPRAELESLMAQVDGRGICAHPSAAVAALRSALDLLVGAS